MYLYEYIHTQYHLIHIGQRLGNQMNNNLSFCEYIYSNDWCEGKVAI